MKLIVKHCYVTDTLYLHFIKQNANVMMKNLSSYAKNPDFDYSNK